MKTQVAFALALTLSFTGIVGNHAEAARSKPDLIVSAVSAPSPASPDATVVVSGTVKNQGKASAKAFGVAYYLSTNPSSTTGAAMLGTGNVSSLAAGASVALVTSFTIPGSTAIGTFYVVAVADSTKVISESNESNNIRASGAIAVQDLTPPSISAVNATGIAANTATIAWSTNEAGTSQVEYGTTATYGSATSFNSSLITNHGMGLSSLVAGTLYHFRVRSKDASGNEALSGDNTFTTVVETSGIPGIYGPGIGGDELANTRVGGPSAPDISYNRFRAEQSSALTSFTLYYLGASAGYAGGTGGIWKAEIFADDGTSDHFPTGSALASQTFAALAVDDAGRTLTFTSPATLVAGTLYHLVYSNIDANPVSNYFSPNYWYYHDSATGTTDGRLNPRFSSTDWAHGYRDGSSWVPRPGYAPILDLAYANGQHQGMSYGEASYDTGEEGGINGTTFMVREHFTVSGGDKVVTGAGVRLLKIAGGTEPLTVQLEDASGNVIDSFTIPASSIADGTNNPGDLGPNAKWVAGSFTGPQTLVNGATYSLRFSTGPNTTYWAWVNRRLSDYGYTTATYFADGKAQKTTDGATWSSLGRVTDQNDLQCYFTTLN